MRRFVFQVLRGVEDGRAGVDDYRLIRLDELGTSFADRLFFSELMRVPSREHELVRTGVRQARAAVRALHCAGAFQNGEVPADSRDGRAHFACELLQRSVFDPLQVLLNAALAFLKLHWHG